jgi:CBS domain-containing protein
VARVVDLSSVDIRHPVVIRRAIDNARDLGDLAEASVLLRPTAVELADAGVPGLRVGALLGAMIEAIVERCVRLDASRADAPEEPPSWLILGSLARREPLPSSDVDTALIWSSSGAPTPPTPEAMQEYAERVIASFETCGLRRCPDGANATDRLFNRSEEAWLAAVNRWTTNPDDPGALLLSAMVCDSRPVTGVHLARELMAVMQHESTRRPYLGRMLAEALAHKPPTGFVRDFVVEASGDHRGELDLKRRGLGPVVAIGRWLSLVAPAASTSTQDRLRAGAAAGLLTRDETDTLRGAHQDMFELLFQREVEAIRSGGAVSTYLRPRTLDTLTRRHLRESFRAIRTVQTRLEAEWALRVRS